MRDAVHATRLRQIAEPHAARKVAQPGPAEVRREPGLAAATHAQHTHQPRARVEAVRKLEQCVVPADKSVAFGGQAVPHLPHRQPQIALTHDSIGLGTVGRRREGRVLVTEFEQLDRFGHALQAPMPMRLKTQGGRPERRAGVRGQQSLPAHCGRHHARGQRLGQAFHLERFGASRNVGGNVLAQTHLAHMQAGTRLQRHRQCGQCAVVGQRVTSCVEGMVEQQQQAVGLVNLAPVPARHQVARHAVMRRPQRGHRGVAEPLRQRCAVHHVGEQHRELIAHKAALRSGCHPRALGPGLGA